MCSRLPKRNYEYQQDLHEVYQVILQRLKVPYIRTSIFVIKLFYSPNIMLINVGKCLSSKV